VTGERTRPGSWAHGAIDARGAALGHRTVGSAIAASVDRHPPRVAIEYDRGSLSFARLDELALGLGHGVLGLAGTDRPTVVALSENRVELAILLVAAARFGMSVAILNWRLSDRELADAVDVVRPHALVASPRHLQRCADVLAPGSQPRARVALDDGEGAPPGWTGFWELIAASATAPPTAPTHPEDILSIVFTSGSSGAPKAAAISHRALVARASVMAAELGLAQHELFLAWAPMSHMVSSDYLLIQLMLGAPTLVIDGFDAARIAHVLARRPVGWLPVMPGTYPALLDEVERQGRPTALRAIGAMADLLDPALIGQVTTATGAGFFNSFGSTEAGTLPVPNTIIPPGVVPTDLRKRQSAFCDVRLVAEDGSDVDAEQPGDMLLRGPTLFSGYWRNPEATLADVSDDGWYRSGDVMVRHDDGTLDFVERRKYMIKSGGENIYPAELERTLIQHPGVAEVAVVRALDERWGETPVAFVARRPGSAVTGPELIEFIGGRLARYKRPREVRFIDVDDFPRNITGKVVRQELEQRLRERPRPDDEP
jgi:fatty-acyl-CoA synthase